MGGEFLLCEPLSNLGLHQLWLCLGSEAYGVKRSGSVLLWFVDYRTAAPWVLTGSGYLYSSTSKMRFLVSQYSADHAQVWHHLT